MTVNVNDIATTSWNDIYEYFSSQTVLFAGPVCHQDELPEPYVVIEYIVETRTDALSGLSNGMKSRNSMVCAYCLLGLRKLLGKSMREIEEALDGRNESVKYRNGSFTGTVSLSEIFSSRRA